MPSAAGLAGGKLEWSFFTLPYECSVATTYWGSIPELMEVIRGGSPGSGRETRPRAIGPLPRLRGRGAGDVGRAGTMMVG